MKLFKPKKKLTKEDIKDKTMEVEKPKEPVELPKAPEPQTKQEPKTEPELTEFETIIHTLDKMYSLIVNRIEVLENKMIIDRDVMNSVFNELIKLKSIIESEIQEDEKHGAKD